MKNLKPIKFTFAVHNNSLMYQLKT